MKKLLSISLSMLFITSISMGAIPKSKNAKTKNARVTKTVDSKPPVPKPQTRFL